MSASVTQLYTTWMIVSSAGRYVIFLADRDLKSATILWSSTKIKRVVRSSLSVEAPIAVDCTDAIYYVKAMIKEM